jgi:hypothetical protein
MRTFKLKKCKRVSQLRFAPDSRRLVAVGASQAFIVETAVTVDVATGAELGRAAMLGTCGVVTPDLSRYVVGGAHEFGEGLPLQWTDPLDPREWNPLVASRTRFPDVQGVACDSTGARLAVAVMLRREQSVVAVLGFGGENPHDIRARGTPTVVAFNHDATRVAAAGGPEGEPLVAVHEVGTGREVIGFEPGGTRTTCLAFLPDGRLAAGSGRKVFVYPPDGDRPQFTLGGHKGQINALAVGPDGRLVSASHDGAIRVWDATSGEQVKVFDWQIGPVTAVAFAPDGLTCAAAGKAGQLVIWDVDG